MFKWVNKFRRSEKGQGMVEYGLILALVSIIAVGALSGLGGKVTDSFGSVFGDIGGITGGSDNPDIIVDEDNLPDGVELVESSILELHYDNSPVDSIKSVVAFKRVYDYDKGYEVYKYIFLSNHAPSPDHPNYKLEIIPATKSKTENIVSMRFDGCDIGPGWEIVGEPVYIFGTNHKESKEAFLEHFSDTGIDFGDSLENSPEDTSVWLITSPNKLDKTILSEREITDDISPVY